MSNYSLVAERGSVGGSSSNHTFVKKKSPQNLPPLPVRDEFDIHTSDEEIPPPISQTKLQKIDRNHSDDDVLSINEESATQNSGFKIKTSAFIPTEKKDNLTIIIENQGQSRPVKSAIIVPPASNQHHQHRNPFTRNPFRRDRTNKNRKNHLPKNEVEKCKRASESVHAKSFHRLLPVRHQNIPIEKRAVPFVAPTNQGQCTHTCTSSQANTSVNDNTKISIDIADLKKLLSAHKSPEKKRKRLSSGQHKRFKKAAENKLKRELGFEKWWELQRANALEDCESKNRK